MNDQPFTMNIERTDGTVKQHGFHLGTIQKTAEFFVFEELRKSDTVSIALKRDGKLVKMFDFRDLEDNQ